jgi:hypothetical protein
VAEQNDDVERSGPSAAPQSDPGAPVGPQETGRSPGWREVLLVGAAVVAVVLALNFGTSLLPSGLQDIVIKSPLAIVVLVVGTVGLLLWVVRRPTPRV